MKVKKGEFGYFRKEKKKRAVITLILFLIPLAAFAGGYLLQDPDEYRHSHCRGGMSAGV